LIALDTGMRQSEIFSLRWRDVDFENGLVNIQAFHTKTMKERQIAMTTRLALELEQLKSSAPENPNGLVFGINDNVKRSFTAARSDAGLKDVRFLICVTRLRRGLWVHMFRFPKLAAFWVTPKRIRHIAT
jgi:integrase